MTSTYPPLGAPQSSTISEVARRHQVGETTVRRQVRDGLLECVKIGRCTRIPLDGELRWLAAGRKRRLAEAESSKGNANG